MSPCRVSLPIDQIVTDGELRRVSTCRTFRSTIESFRVKPQPFVAISHAVPLDVRLRSEVDSIAVAEIVPQAVVGIVTRAHGVHVVAFHERNVSHHVIERHCAPVLRARLVAVHALELHRLAVDENAVAVDSLLLEAYSLRAHVAAFRHDERVEVRILGAPELWIRDLRWRMIARRETGDELFIGIVQRRRPLAVNAFDRQFRRIAFFIFDFALYVRLEVPYPVLRTRPQRHVAEYPGEAKHVLVFEIAAVAPLINLHGDQILAILLDVRRDVELGRQLGILRIAGEFAVHPHVERRPYALETKDRVASLPALRQRERAAVGRHGVEVWPAARPIENLRRRLLVRIPVVGVDGRAVAAHLDAARHVNDSPAGIVEVRRLESLRTPRRVADPAESPLAVQRHSVWRGELQLVRQRGGLVRERHRVRPRRKTVDGIDGRVLPFRRGGQVAAIYSGGRHRRNQQYASRLHLHFSHLNACILP